MTPRYAQMSKIHTENDLVAAALALIGSRDSLSEAERRHCEGVKPWRDSESLDALSEAILVGHDPLGEAFMRVRDPETRRVRGATFTPHSIVASMLSWAVREASPARIVDPGAGSGRFLLAAGERFPDAALIGVESDPLAALLLRAAIAVKGLSDRTTVLVNDYRDATLPDVSGNTLFIGNPPYVRHHNIGEEWKTWFAAAAAKFGIRASKLAGLHIHFFVRTMELAKPGDAGAFITSAEWLDVNYGATLRKLLADGLGGVAIHVLDPKAMPFTGTATTGAITCFRVGKRPDTLTVRAVETPDRLKDLSGGVPLLWSEVERVGRWSAIVRPRTAIPSGYTELGEIVRVHRGQVTGGNDVWIAGHHTAGLPSDVLVPAVTKARDIFEAGEALRDASRLRKVVNLPPDLDELDPSVLPAVQRFVSWAKRRGADQSYIARHRRAWWSVGLKEPAPIVCTYMARRPPAFVLNLCDARHINIAHGLYPKEPLSDEVLAALAAWLRKNVGIENGRTYAGGLTKFEPRELERVPVPLPENLLV